MTKNAFPFADFTKAFGEFKMPMVDMNAMVEAQQKNFDAFAAANQVAFDGARAVIERQVELVQTAVEEAQASVKEMTEGGTPNVDVTKQGELAKAAMEKAMANAKELSDMVSKSQNEAFEIVNKRVQETVEEVKAQFQLN